MNRIDYDDDEIVILHLPQVSDRGKLVKKVYVGKNKADCKIS